MRLAEPRRAWDLLVESRSRGPEPREGALLRFAGVGGRDTYNITAPFQIGGEIVIAGRVEARGVELAETVFFTEGSDAVWRPRPGARRLAKLQDPCVARIGDEWVIGGVEFPVMLPGKERPGWRMSFYRGRSLEGLEPFLQGPDHMKDIRLVELTDGCVGVCSRPQGVRGGRGAIGFTVADSLEELSAPSIDAAPMLTGQFLPQEWGGANELHRLSDGRLGILGHIAWMQERGAVEEKHYYPMAFTLDPRTGSHTPPKVIACREHFPSAPAKRPGLEDVIFSGGLVRNGDGTAWLYAGLSDAAAGRTLIGDPFEEYE